MPTVWFYLLSLILSIYSPLSWAQENKGLILKNSDSMIRDHKNDLIILNGNVQLIFNLQYLAAEKAVIHTKNKTIEAKGNVVYNTPNLYAEADRIYFNYKKDTGIIYNGFIQSGQISFEGKIIYKIGEKEFEVEDGYYTSCFTCPPAWSMSGTRIRANFGKSAVLRNTTFRAAKLPLFWLPYMEIPLHSNRQSGFLTPELEQGKQAGYTFSLPYYYVISEAKDITITPKSYQNRGLKTLFQYRYRLTPNAAGELQTAWIQDVLFPKTDILKNSSSAPTNTDGSIKKIDRWFLSYKHSYLLPNHFEHKVDLNLTSDLQYPLDFQKEVDFIGEPALTNHMSLSKNTHTKHFSISSDIYVNLLKSDPLASNDDAVHRLPDIRYDMVSTRIKNTNIYYNLHANYTNFSRSSYSFDKMDASYDYEQTNYDLTDSSQLETYKNGPVRTHDGTYNPDNDLIRTGQRLILRPELYYPIRLGKFNITPGIVHQENLYQFAVESKKTAESRFTQFYINAKTQFSKVYSGSKNKKIKHNIEPIIEYRQIPFNYQQDHPFFGNDELEPYSPDRFISDEDTIQFDYLDRQSNKNIVTLKLVNWWIEKTNINGTYQYHERINWQLSQSYDLYDQSINNQVNQPWSSIASKLKVYYPNYALTQDLYYYPYHNVINSKSAYTYYLPNSSRLSLTYDQSFNVQPGEAVDTNSDVKQDWELLTRLNYKSLNFAAQINYSTITHEVVNWKTGLILTPPGDCWSIILTKNVPTRGDETTSIYFNLLFDGKTESNLLRSLL